MSPLNAVRPPAALAPGRRLELRLAIGVAVALVLARAVLPTVYEQLDFDSDQAIVGLMAKHLSELHAFPLFFYGQHYMLAVQSWIAVPFFWIGGPTLAMLRLPLVALNAGVAALLIRMLARNGVRPLYAFVSALPVVVTTPVVSTALVETLGASIEPLMYVLLLWALRHRPAAFGAALCAATLHREFTIFALPAAIIAQRVEGRAWRSGSFARAGGAFAGVWIAVAALTRALNAAGPPGGIREGGSLVDEARLVASWLSFRPAPYVARLHSVLTIGLPDLLGARTYQLPHYNVNSALDAGSVTAGVALAAAVAVCGLRLLWIARDACGRGDLRKTSFELYLGLVAIQALAAYGLNGGIDPAAPVILRYFLFALFLPVALFGAFFLVDASRGWRVAVACLAAVWAACTLQDNARLAREYLLTPPPSEFRTLADYLTAHHIKYGRAQYWDCYIVDFLARERVILASTGPVRVSEYQTRVERNAPNAVTVERQPCSGGDRVASWCVGDPLAR